MTTKHTPAPWFVKPQGEPGGYAVHADLRQHGHVNAPPIVFTNRLGVPYAESEANARLIAAAPELLEAAELGLMALDPSTPDYATIKEAIAKARGQHAR